MIRFIPQYSGQNITNIKNIADEYGISPVLAQIILNRGFDFDDILKSQKFNDPFLLNDMQKCVDLIRHHIDNNSKIVIYGDYDVDGVTSTSILYMYFRSIGANVDYHIPNRHETGYGLSITDIDEVLEKGKVDLIITVDCGITNLNEADYIKSKGIDLIVTDHHQLLDTLPKCDAVVNPLLNNYPCSYLCGCGVALKVIEALGGESERDKYIDLACIASIADLVSLTGENRTIVKKGLEKINKEPRYSVIALLNVAGVNGKVDAGHIGFGLAPRINAVGRLASAGVGVELLTSESFEKSLALSHELDDANKERQRQEKEIFDDAVRMIESSVDLSTQRIIILCSENWNKGVIGIVASKLLEIYHRPIILFSKSDGVCSGSCRSISGVHIFNILNRFGDMLLKYGGHELAAGLSMNEDRLEEFKQVVNKYILENIPDEVFIPTVFYDMELKIKDIDLKLINDLEKLAPMGMGNKTPVFLLKNVKLSSAKLIGNDKSHIKLNVVDKEYSIGAMAFGRGDRFGEIDDQNSYDVVCTVDKNTWNGVTTPQVYIKQFKKNISNNIRNIVEQNAQSYLESIISSNDFDRIEELSKELRQMWRGDVYIQRRVQKDVLGTVIYSSVPKASVELLEMLNKNNLLDNVDVCAKEPVDNSCVVLAPDYSKYDFNHQRLVIYDYAPSGFVEKVIENNPNMEIVICNNEFINNNISDFITMATVSRDEAVKNYVVMKKALEIFHDKDTIISLLCKNVIENRFNALLYFEVFKELGIIEVENDKVRLNANVKVDFESSNIKKIINEAISKIPDEIDVLLNNCKKRY